MIEKIEANEHSDTKAKVMWIVAHNKEFFRRFCFDKKKTGLKTLYRQMAHEIQDKFSCSSDEVIDLVSRGASFYSRIYR